MNKTAILGIDLQNDFTSPDGSLFVKNADKDMVRIAAFIKANQKEIDYIALTLDSHQPVHIAHQSYWKDKNGNSPSPYSTISAASVREGEWFAQYNKNKALIYLEQLEAKGDACTIWPMHCILGTEGWAINKVTTDSLVEWSTKTGRSYELYQKGYSQSTEHYSIFKAAVEWENEPNTQLNKNLLERLNSYDRLIIVGEAADYCVANSLNDILSENRELAKKTIIFTDCMSWIDSNNEKAKAIFEKATNLGVKFQSSTDFSLS